MKRLIAGAIALALASTSAIAQLAPQTGRYVDADGHVKLEEVTAGKQEAIALVTANTASPPKSVYGGDYILSQTCAAYGTVNLQVLGPDRMTYQTLISKTAADTAGGSGLALGSNATVQITLSGTTGCNVLLSRVP